jgi:hypothetical protein
MVDDPISIAEILPPVIADRIRIMMGKAHPQHVRENARTTLLLIRDELDKALTKAAKEFIRRN